MNNVVDFIKNIDGDFNRYQYIMGLSSDRDKLSCLSYLNSNSYKAFIVASLNSDQNKISYLSMILDDHSRYLIIKSFKSEYLKYRYIPLIQAEDLKKELVLLISRDDYKEVLLKDIGSSYFRSIIVSSLISDDVKINYLDEFSEAGQAKVIASLSSDVLKFQYLSLLKDDDNLTLVVGSFKDDEFKLKSLDRICSEENKVVVISKLVNYKDMAKALNTIHDYAVQLCITQLLESDEEKIHLIQETNDRLQIDLVASLSSVQYKLEFLKQIKNPFYRMIIMISLPDEIKENMISLVDSFEEKMALIYSLQDHERRANWINLFGKHISFDLGIDLQLIFGLEIEVEGINSEEIKKWDFGKDNYRGTIDETLIHGVEIKTPKLRNEYDSLEKLYYIFNMIHYAGFSCSNRCGGHIHFDANYFQNKQEYLTLFELWSDVEDILYLIANRSGEIPRSDVVSYACPLFQSFQDRMDDGTIVNSLDLDDQQFIDELHSWQESKHNSLNIRNVNKSKNTIEFRISNGSMSFVTWMQNIVLYGHLLMASKRLAALSTKKELNREEQNLWNLKEILKLNVSKEDKLEVLLDLLFQNDLRKEVYRERFYANRSALEKCDVNPLSNAGFYELDFTRVRKS